MGVIREELRLSDQFSAAFSKFIQLGEKAQGRSDLAKNSLKNYESVLNGLDKKLISSNAQFEAVAQEQEKLAQAGRTNSAEFSNLETKANKLGNTIRTLESQYNATYAQMQKVIDATKQESSAANKAVQSQSKHESILKKVSTGLSNIVKRAIAVGKSQSAYTGLTRQLNRFAISIMSVTRIINAAKNALERAPESIQNSFSKAGENIQNLFAGGIVSMLGSLQPEIDRFNAFLESEKGAKVVNALSQAFGVLGQLAGMALGAITSGLEYISDNWNSLAPIIVAGATAIGLVMVGSAVASAAAWLAATWPLLLIIGVIALIIYIVNQAGVSFSEIFQGIGSVAGWLYALLYNLIADIWNVIAVFAEFFANVFDDPVGSIARLFFGIFDAILGVVETVAGAIDSLLGTNMAGAVSGFRSQMQSWVDDTFGESKIKIDRMEKIDYNDTANAWGAAGANLGSSLDNFSMGDLTGMFTSMGDIQSGLATTASNTGAIADNTDSLKKDVSLSQEDIKMLVDMAERQYINKINLQTNAPNITVNATSGDGKAINGRALANAIRDILLEESSSSTVRTYSVVI